MIGGTPKRFSNCELLVMNRQKQNLPLRLEAPLKSKGAALPTPFDYGGDENAVKGRDERQRTAPLTAFSSRRRRLPFLRLTTAVVVIDGMTDASGVFFNETSRLQVL